MTADEEAGGGSGTRISICDVEMPLETTLRISRAHVGEESGNVNTSPDLGRPGAWGSQVGAESPRQTKDSWPGR